MKNNTTKKKIIALALSSIIATTSLSNTSININNKKESIYNILINNDNLDDNSIDILYSNLVNEFNYGKTKIINNKLNYLYYIFTNNSNNNYYYDYLDNLTGQYISPSIDEYMVPQGITTYENNIIISAYNENRIYKSSLYLINKDTNTTKKIELDNNSHVGGIAYDNTNNLLWITVRDQLYGYKIEELLYKDKIYKKYETYNTQDIGNYSFLTYKDNKLYIGNYKINKESVIKVYRLSKSKVNNNINFIPEQTLTIPSQVQGMDIINIGKKQYLLLSRSCYMFNNSEILIYQYDKDNNKYTNNYISKIICPPMLEEIAIDNNSLLTLFESGSSKYKDCLTNISNIYYTDIKKKLKKNNNY